MIRLICKEDSAQLSQYFMNNLKHFACWEPLRGNDYYSELECAKRIEKIEQSENKSVVMLVLLHKNQIVGHCELSQVIYGPFKACYIGYGLSKELEGLGRAFDMCTHAISYAFQELGLHRVMANYMPSNKRSEKLLARLGFRKEGVAHSYLKIAGKWEDHVLTSLINPNNA